MTREELDKMILESNPREKDLGKYKKALLDWVLGDISEGRFRELAGYDWTSMDTYSKIRDMTRVLLFEILS